MAKPLTQLTIDSLKAVDKRREVPDGRVGGLYLVVQASGAKSWAVQYRSDCVQKKYTLGPHPAVDLDTARRRALEALGDVAGGEWILPPPRGPQGKPARRLTNDRLADVAASYIERYAKRSVGPGWARETQRLLKVEIVPKLGAKRLSDIRRADVHDLLDDILDRGAPFTANRTLSVLRRVFNWSVEREIISASPIDGMKPPAVEASRDRVLNDDEIRPVWDALDAVGHPFCAFGKLLFLTGARRAEAAGVKWAEVDLDAGVWTLPAERTKNGRQHQVPLADMAVRILQDLPRIGVRRTVSFSRRPATTAVSGYSHAKAAIDRAISAEMATWTFHDIRRTVATNLQKLGVRLEVTEAVLNHVSGSRAGIVGIYQRHSWSEEKRAALDAWARKLEAIVTDAEASNVVALARAR